MHLLIATTNVGKVREIVPLLSDLPITLLTLADIPAAQPAKEEGDTFDEIARLKARYYATTTGVLTVAEDSGLEIDALNGAPGVESARLGGPTSTYREKFALIYDALRTRASAGRTARFVCALTLADGEQVLFESKGIVEGAIAPEPRGNEGFGYDPIFFYPPFGCTFAEAGERKFDVSHRTQAFRKLHEFLSSLIPERTLRQ